MKKHISVFLALVLLVGTAILPVHAAAPDISPEIEVICTEYGNLEVETTLVVHDSLFRSSTKSADKIQTVKLDGTVIAEVTLSATFSYDGTTARVTSASGSHTTSGGWSYKNESISKSGDTAELTANLTKLLYPTLDVEITLSCTPSGQIS